MKGKALVLVGGYTAPATLAWVAGLVAEMGSVVRLAVHVSEDTCLAGDRGRRDPAQYDAMAHARLESFRRELGPLGTRVELTALHGELLPALSSVLSASDLLVVIEPDAAEDDRWLSRLEALHAAWRSGCPALLVPALRPPPGRGRILVTFDGSKASRSSFPLAVKMARALDWDIVLLKVLPFEEEGWGADEASLQLLRRRRSVAAATMQAEAEALARQGVRVRAATFMGSPVRIIVRAARLLRADMVLLSDRGRSQWGSRGPGSVATAVFLRSPVPCLLVPSAAASQETGGED
jgi:nucleotide-binding universal stress UspA family protein